MSAVQFIVYGFLLSKKNSHKHFSISFFHNVTVTIAILSSTFILHFRLFFTSSSWNKYTSIWGSSRNKYSSTVYSLIIHILLYEVKIVELNSTSMEYFVKLNEFDPNQTNLKHLLFVCLLKRLHNAWNYLFFLSFFFVIQIIFLFNVRSFWRSHNHELIDI